MNAAGLTRFAAREARSVAQRELGRVHADRVDQEAALDREPLGPTMPPRPNWRPSCLSNISANQFWLVLRIGKIQSRSGRDVTSASGGALRAARRASSRWWSGWCP